ncbi:MAG: hypothetical protein CFH44_00314 [Proteobacteria bacterium]|nr:MAG: hypothetical protein CFH44_00314 [Pseudomonadota bacterium]|tara:strand:- start:73 stop:459 length:387 start_codon:yes stop_codon:yes gene_type:complete
MRNMRGQRPPSAVLGIVLLCLAVFYHLKMQDKIPDNVLGVAKMPVQEKVVEVPVKVKEKTLVAVKVSSDIKFYNDTTGSQSLGFLQKGQEFYVLDFKKTQNGQYSWIKVRTNGLGAWVPAKSVELIYK